MSKQSNPPTKTETTSAQLEPSTDPNASTTAIGQADGEEFLDGFLRVEAEVRAVPQDKLSPVNLEVIGAVATGLGALRKIVKLRDDMAALKGLDITKLDKLRDYAFALARAHSAHRGALGPTDPNSAMAEELVDIRNQLFSDAQALGKRKLLDLGRVEKFRSGLGYKNLALDVDGLVSLFREAWPKLADKTPVTQDELEHAAQLAQRLVTGVGVKEQDPAILTAATALREQAFYLFINAYDEVRRGVLFLRWHENDADTIAPSLWAGRSGKRPVEAPPPEPDPTSPAPPPTKPATNTSTTDPSDIATLPGIGLPGSPPFTK